MRFELGKTHPSTEMEKRRGESLFEYLDRRSDDRGGFARENWNACIDCADRAVPAQLKNRLCGLDDEQSLAAYFELHCVRMLRNHGLTASLAVGDGLPDVKIVAPNGSVVYLEAKLKGQREEERALDGRVATLLRDAYPRVKDKRVRVWVHEANLKQSPSLKRFVEWFDRTIESHGNDEQLGVFQEHVTYGEENKGIELVISLIRLTNPDSDAVTLFGGGMTRSSWEQDGVEGLLRLIHGVRTQHRKMDGYVLPGIGWNDFLRQPSHQCLASTVAGLARERGSFELLWFGEAYPWVYPDTVPHVFRAGTGSKHGIEWPFPATDCD